MSLPVRPGVAPARTLAPLAALVVLWILWFPRSPDLAAQVYRTHLFAVSGFSLWDNNWYGGHYLPDYSLLSPALGALLGLRWLGALAVAFSTIAFVRLTRERFGPRAWPAAGLFAVGAIGDLFIGRITFAIGVAFAMGSVLAATRGHRGRTALLSAGCAAASPVAALFLALVAGADLLAHRAWTRGAVLAIPALVLTGALTALFPEGGQESFGMLSFLAAGGASVMLLVLLPHHERLLRYGLRLYLLALAVSYVLPTPMGSNCVRLGVLLCPALFVGTVTTADLQRVLAGMPSFWPRRLGPARTGRRLSGRRAARLALATTALALVLWQVNGPISQSLQASADASSKRSYYQPVVRFLAGVSSPSRVEVPFTWAHWESVALGERFALARGWERQLDVRYNPLFYRPHLTALAYYTWLRTNAVRFIALPDAPLDSSSREEAALVRSRPTFLHEVFASAHWRVFEVSRAQPLARGPGRLVTLAPAGFTLHARHRGVFIVQVHFTPYWTVTAGTASVRASTDGWTAVTVAGPGSVAVEARLHLRL